MKSGKEHLLKFVVIPVFMLGRVVGTRGLIVRAYV